MLDKLIETREKRKNPTKRKPDKWKISIRAWCCSARLVYAVCHINIIILFI